MLKVAFVGWRGLVGSVLLDRMKQENDFSKVDLSFFSSSSPGGVAPHVDGVKNKSLGDAFNLDELLSYDVVLTCQGSAYTKEIYSKLREKSWKGYWLDAASHLRLLPSSTLLLDPFNGDKIQTAFLEGKKDFIGANCTVSLMMLALHGLFKSDLVEWIHTSSYQAISGSGSKAISALFEDIGAISQTLEHTKDQKNIPQKISLAHEALQKLSEKSDMPRLGANVFPWIDSESHDGKTKEEAKGEKETNKILGSPLAIPVDGTCVRVPVLRSHSQNLTLKLKKTLTISEMESLLQEANPWVKVITNQQKESLQQLVPTKASETLDILVGRIRKLALPGELYEIFTVGDQLLWGAAEPLRRGLQLIVDFHNKNS